MTHRPEGPPVPILGGKLAVFLFIATLLAFVIESQLTQYVQTTLQYRHPFFILYIVHSSFGLIFPLHLLLLTTTTTMSMSSLLSGLSFAISNQLLPKNSLHSHSSFPWRSFIRFAIILTAGLTCPSLLWFASISLTSISDVTAIWNTNAFFAYIMTVMIFNLKWEPRRLMAVCLATFGTLLVVYGGTTSPAPDGPLTKDEQAVSRRTESFRPTAPLVGDLLTLIASFGYGLYQVLYKKYVALPNDPEGMSDAVYEAIPGSEAGVPSDIQCDPVTASALPDHAVYPPPFGLHPNALTSAIGLCTIALLWIPIPFLHYLGMEPFSWPSDLRTVLAICGIAFSGLAFNAGFMILLGVWGPIITSVGNLLTIVLVFFSDVFFGAGVEAVTVWGLAGSGIIVAAFGVLAYDMTVESR